MTAAIGKAAIMLTDCKLLMELSENTKAIGSAIRRTHHINLINACGNSFSSSVNVKSSALNFNPIHAKL